MAARSVRFALLSLLFLLGTVAAGAQPSLRIFNIDPSNYPIVSAEFYAYDEDGEFVRDLTTNDLIITENQVRAPILNLTCPARPAPPVISAVLTIDLSGSMNTKINNSPLTRLDVVKEGAVSWLRRMELDSSVCAVTSFNSRSYINQYFSRDRNRLVDVVNALQAFDGGTNYDEAMIGWPAGGLTVARTGTYKRVLVFLTDGLGSFTNEEAVIDLARKNDIEVYCLAVGLAAPNALRRLAKETGGICFDYLSDADEIRQIYELILERIQGEPPCRVEWLSKGNCFGGRQSNRVVSVGIPALTVADVSQYPAPPPSGEFLSVIPSTFHFGSPAPGGSYELATELKGVNGTITIEEIKGTNPLFSIVELEEQPNFLPRTLAPGETLSLTVRFSPVDTLLAVGEFIVETDACEDPVITCTGGFRGIEFEELRLVHPNGGESFIVGADTVIRWEGILPEDPVRLEYSVDGGATWDLIVPETSGLSYLWHVPNRPSSTCLARITQLSSKERIALLPHNSAVVDMAFMPDGRRVVTLTDEGIVSVWDGLKGTLVSMTGGTSRASQLAVSPDGKLAAVGNPVDRTVLVWNLEDGALLHKLPNAYYNNRWLSQGLKGTLCFTPDSRGLVSVGVTALRDTALYLWDVPSGSLLREIKDPRAFYNHGTFSPDGQRFLIGGKEGILQEWDPALTTVSETLHPYGEVVRIGYTYNSEYLYIVSRETDGKLVVQITGDRVNRRLYLPESFMIDFDVHSLESGFLMSDGEATLREGVLGDIVREFPGHTGTVNATCFNSDGSLIATGSNDGTVRIWAARTLEVAQDQSDTLWEIVVPAIDGVDVDFGRVPVGRQKDSIIQACIRNVGPVPAHILELKLAGNHPSDFTILSGNGPFDLAPGEARTVEIGFKPWIAGGRRAKMRIITQSDTLERNLTGIGVIPPVKIIGLTGDYIDFGKVTVGGKRDSLAVAVNTGTAEVRIDSLLLLGPDNEQFLLTGPFSAITLAPGDSLRIPLAFAPERIGITNSTVGLFYSEIGSPALVGLIGEGIISNAPAIAGPDVVRFSPQLCAGFADTSVVRIGNPGDAPLTIDGVEIQGGPPFTMEPVRLPQTIDPGGFLDITIIFLPTDEGIFSGSLHIVSDASNAPELIVPLEGELARVELAAEADTIDLGKLCPGEPVSFRIGLLNSGRLPGVILERMVWDGTDGSILRLEEGIGTIDDSGADSALFTFIPSDSSGMINATVEFLDTVCRTLVSTNITGRVARPQIRALPVAEVCPGEEVVLRAEGGDRYEWFPSEELSCSDCPSPTLHPTASGFYYVSGYDAAGCAGIDSVFVGVREEPFVLQGSIGREYRNRPGDTVRFAARLETLPPVWSDVRELHLKLRYDPGVLRIDPTLLALPGEGTLLEGWEMELEEALPGSIALWYRSTSGIGLTGTGDLFRVQGEIFLANVPGTEMEWELSTPGNCLRFETGHGYLAVDSICGLNYRLFEVGAGKYHLYEPRPNPALGDDVKIDFSLGLDGQTRMILVDAMGRSRLILDNYLQAGEYQALVRTAELEPGVYFIRVESGDWNRQSSVRVLK